MIFFVKMTMDMFTPLNATRPMLDRAHEIFQKKHSNLQMRDTWAYDFIVSPLYDMLEASGKVWTYLGACAPEHGTVLYEFAVPDDETLRTKIMLAYNASVGEIRSRSPHAEAAWRFKDMEHAIRRVQMEDMLA